MYLSVFFLFHGLVLPIAKRKTVYVFISRCLFSFSVINESQNKGESARFFVFLTLLSGIFICAKRLKQIIKIFEGISKYASNLKTKTID